MSDHASFAIERTYREVQNDLLARFGEGPEAKYIPVHGHRHRFILKQIVPMLTQGASVLDLGSYPFCITETLTRLGFNAIGGGLWPEISFELPFTTVQLDCDREPLPFDDDSLDAVVFSEIFEHLYVNPLGAIEEIHRVLRPGGIFYLTTPNLIGLRALTRTLIRGTVADDAYKILAGVKAGVKIGHFREYTPKEIHRILQMTGFTDVKTTTANPYRKQIIETWFWRIVSAPFRNGRETIVSVGFK